MKLLTVNFLSCPVRACRSSPKSFPLHFKDCELASDPDGNPYNRDMLVGVLPRLEWDAVRISAGELGLVQLLPEEKPVVELGDPSPSLESLPDAGEEEDEEEEEKEEKEGGEEKEKENEGVEAVLRRVWEVLVQTQVTSGKLVCASCSHEFGIQAGIANFLLPGHMV